MSGVISGAVLGLIFPWGTAELAKKWQAQSSSLSKKSPLERVQDFKDRNLCIQNLFALACPTLQVSKELEKAVFTAVNISEGVRSVDTIFKDIPIQIGVAVARTLIAQQMQTNRYLKPVALALSGLAVYWLGKGAYEVLSKDSKDRTWTEFAEDAFIQGVNVSAATYRTLSLTKACRKEFFPTLQEKMDNIIELKDSDPMQRACKIFSPACSQDEKTQQETIKRIFKEEIAPMHPDKNLGSQKANEAFRLASEAKQLLKAQTEDQYVDSWFVGFFQKNCNANQIKISEVDESIAREYRDLSTRNLVRCEIVAVDETVCENKRSLLEKIENIFSLCKMNLPGKGLVPKFMN